MPLVLKGKFVLFIFDKYYLNGMEQDFKILQIFPFNMHRAETLRLRLKGSQYKYANIPLAFSYFTAFKKTSSFL